MIQMTKERAMSRISRLGCVFVGLCVLLGATAAEATRPTVLINTKKFRRQMKPLVRGNTLSLRKPLVGTTSRISKFAVRKARRTAQGFGGFNYRAGARNYVLDGANPLIVTTAKVQHHFSLNDWRRSYTHFVARDGQSGVVVGRGFVKDGSIVWTRSKNGGKRAPIERNAAR
jgi:hypothetical protein